MTSVCTNCGMHPAAELLGLSICVECAGILGVRKDPQDMNTRERLGLPDPDRPLLKAARENDAITDSRGFEGALREMDLDFEELKYVAEQRALRVRLLQTGRIDEVPRASAMTLDGSTRQRLLNQDPYYPKLSAEDNEAIQMLTGLYIDAIALGWRARLIEMQSKGAE
jgi:hypothetical protein